MKPAVCIRIKFGLVCLFFGKVYCGGVGFF